MLAVVVSLIGLAACVSVILTVTIVAVVKDLGSVETEPTNQGGTA